MAKKTKKGWGGKRKNAGRKAESPHYRNLTGLSKKYVLVGDRPEPDILEPFIKLYHSWDSGEIDLSKKDLESLWGKIRDRILTPGPYWRGHRPDVWYLLHAPFCDAPKFLHYRAYWSPNALLDHGPGYPERHLHWVKIYEDEPEWLSRLGLLESWDNEAIAAEVKGKRESLTVEYFRKYGWWSDTTPILKDGDHFNHKFEDDPYISFRARLAQLEERAKTL